MRIGYACMNITLRDAGFNKKRLYKKKFEELGLQKVAEITLHNIEHLARVIEWNEQNRIRLFRFTQIFPWIDQYELEDLPQFDLIERNLRAVGQLAKSYNHRLTIHPSEFCVVASTTEASVHNSIRELNQVARIFDLMGYEPSSFNKINIHVGGVYGDKNATSKRFCENLMGMGSEGLIKRLTIENDDRGAGFSLLDLYELIHKQIGIPLVLDYFHHTFNTGDLSLKEALELAISTWPKNITPIIHYSESRRGTEDSNASRVAHSSNLYGFIETYGYNLDIMVEAKQTERAVLQYLSAHESLANQL